MDEPQVRKPAEDSGGTVQGLARAQDHHRRGSGLQSASGPQSRRLRKAPGDEGDLVRKPPQEVRPAARAEDPQPSPGEPGRKARGGQQHGRRVPSRCGHQPGPGLAQGRHRLADDPVRSDHQAAGPGLGEGHQRALMVPALAIGVRLDEHKGPVTRLPPGPRGRW
ncbi:hypothetical protein NKH18_12375 [Streptomyces sp. M10(2022)]